MSSRFRSCESFVSNPIYVTKVSVSEDYIEPDKPKSLFGILGIKTIPFNPNPFGFSNGEDCMVRAICALLYVGKQKITEKEYNDVYMKLAETGAKQGRIMNHIWVLAEFLKGYGYTAVQPEDGVTVASFLCTHRTGRYIVSCSSHVYAYIDGTIYDLLTMFENDELILSHYTDVIYCPNYQAESLFQ